MSKYFKYRRTPHLPWSEKQSLDDKRLSNADHFIGKEVIVSIKMDGENTTMYPHYIHARSLTSGHHESRSWVKKLWSEIGYQLPEGWRICGENLYAVHTIKYNKLKSYFYVYSIWNEHNDALSWDDTLEYCKLLKLEPVTVLYRGIYDEKIIKGLFQKEIDGEQCEGYVIRLADSFNYNDFPVSVAKFVSDKFEIAENKHWAQQKVVPNGLLDAV